MLKTIRRVLALFCFTLLTLLFLDVSGVLHHWFGWLAKVQFLPAVLALNVAVVVVLCVLTLVFGRIYCSVICPLGVMQDGFAWLGRRQKKNRYTWSPERRWLRYVMLIVMLAALLAGVSAVYALLEPYSAFGRIVNSLFRPLYAWANNGLALLAERMDSYAFYSVDVWLKSLPTLLVAAVTLVTLAVLAWRGGRTYCNTICPVGTVLSFLARFSWLKVRIDSDRCIKCGLCAKNCKASCIDFKNCRVDYSRCVVCGDCIGKCNKQAIRYTARKAKPAVVPPETKTAPDGARRAFLAATALSATAALAQEGKKVDGGLAVVEQKVAPVRQTPVTPPGSLSAAHMAQHCTACQLCVTTCPNNVLRPSSNLSTFMQPTSSFERGFCRPECVKCSEVCPTGAISPITRAEKTAIQAGHAVWIKKNCVPLTDERECGNCARHCPVGAITMVPLDENDETSLHVPAVNEARCIGCGACEHVCPASPLSAIIVEGHEVHRTI